ncbi:MAG: glutathione S-transferase family protein [Pseudomonadota bacterium]
MITLHQLHMSPFNDKVKGQLYHKGINFEERFWGITELKQVKRFNPTGKLPVLEHDGRYICDSTDIVHYIESAFPEKPMIPRDQRLAGLMHAIEDWADESLYFYEMHLRFTTPGNAERNMQRFAERENAFIRWLMPKVGPRSIRKTTYAQGVGRKSLEQLLLDVERHTKAVADMLGENDWLLGEGVTLADLAVYCMFKALADVDTANILIEKYPVVPAWMSRVAEITDPPVHR